MVDTVGGSVSYLGPFLTAEMVDDFEGGREALRLAMLAVVDDNLRPPEEITDDLGSLDTGAYTDLAIAISAETSRVYGVYGGDVDVARQQLTAAIDRLLNKIGTNL